MSKIFLLSGPVHTGKTTRLSEWIKNKDGVDGILQPVIDGMRYIQHISSGEIRLLEITPDSPENKVLTIGNYKFNNEVFIWAQSKLLSAFSKNPQWLIIDEVGKLEMSEKGLEPSIKRIFYKLNDFPDMNLVFVVRDYLVSDFLTKYSLNKKDICNLDI